MKGSESTHLKEVGVRKRVGKIIFSIGLLLLVSIITLDLGVVLVDAYSGNPLSVTHNITKSLLFIGLFMVFIGLIMTLYPEGLTLDCIHVIKTGPFIR